MQMPAMDGIELAQKIREHYDKHTLPLIMLTSLDSGQVIEQRQYFAAFLSKPIKASALFNAILNTFVKESALEVVETTLPAQSLDQNMSKRFPLRILIAEDNQINQKLAVLTLKRLGYMADLVGNGLEAIENIRAHPYDVVLMDVQMPEMDGLTATKFIRSDQSLSQPYIIALTANATVEDRQVCLDAGMDDYLSKPFRLGELVGVLETVSQISKEGV
jgi:CheY-like chemotaxis protein